MLDWLPEQGVRYQPSLGGTLSLGRTNSFFLGGGRSMLNALYLTAESLGVAIEYEAEVVDLDIDNGMFLSATVQRGGQRHTVRAATFVAACGGFESNIEWLKQYWGPAADNFLIRGTPHNRGTVLKLLLDRGVQETGDPTQCHAVAIDARAPKYDGGIITRHDSVIFGIVVNKHAQRFYDEGRGDLAEALCDLGAAGGAAAGPDRLHHLRLVSDDDVHADALSADRSAEHPQARRQAGARSRHAGSDGARLQRRGAARHLRRHDPRRLPHRRASRRRSRIGRGASRPHLIMPIRCAPASPSRIWRHA